MHSYREAYGDGDDDADGRAAVSPMFSSGGEAHPLTPTFPVSPQTPYFNMCKFTSLQTEGASRPYSIATVSQSELYDCNKR